MRIAAWLVSVCMSFVVGSAQAEPTQPNRNTDIEKVIERQIEAFKADDFKSAFEYAAPGIQQRFGSPEKFAFTVIHRYPMVWRPSQVQYLKVEQYRDHALQTVMITDHNNTLHILVYEMVPIDKTWRIGGVKIVRQPKSDT
ncbi:MAG: DUF4864 domain-containing protein [Burkholderiaceae bacterium]|nr:DUF4864 domain-containing protein [Burkholderiaceae bacterium]